MNRVINFAGILGVDDDVAEIEHQVNSPAVASWNLAP